MGDARRPAGGGRSCVLVASTSFGKQGLEDCPVYWGRSLPPEESRDSVKVVMRIRLKELSLIATVF